MNFRKFLFSPQRTVPHAIWGLDPKAVRAALRDRGARVRAWHRVKTGSLSFLIDVDGEDIRRFGPHGTANRLSASMQYWLELQGCGQTIGATVVPAVATRVDDDGLEDSPRMYVFVTRNDESDAGNTMMAVARDRRKARAAARKELGETARSFILKTLAEADPKARLARYGYRPVEAGAAPDMINHEKYYLLTQPVSLYGGYGSPRYEYKALRALVSAYRRHNGVRVGIGIAFSGGHSGPGIGSAYFDSPSDWNTVMNGVVEQLHEGVSKIVAMSSTHVDLVESHVLWLLKEIQRAYDPSFATP